VDARHVWPHVNGSWNGGRTVAFCGLTFVVGLSFVFGTSGRFAVGAIRSFIAGDAGRFFGAGRFFAGLVFVGMTGSSS
jgi:hypothetical protein